MTVNTELVNIELDASIVSNMGYEEQVKVALKMNPQALFEALARRDAHLTNQIDMVKGVLSEGIAYGE